MASTRNQTAETKNANYIFSAYAVKAVRKLVPAETEEGSPDQSDDETVGYVAHFIDECNRILQEINEIKQPKPGDPLKMNFDARAWLRPVTSQGGLFPTTDMKTEVNRWADRANHYLTLPLIRRPLDPAATLVVAASLYVEAAWKAKFDPCQTADHRFYLLNGRSVRAPFVTSKEDQYIREFSDFKILRLPLKQGEDTNFSMFLLLPNDVQKIKQLRVDVGDVEETFIQDHYPHERVQVCEFRIPKFEIGSVYSVDKINLHSNGYIDFDEDGIRAVGAAAWQIKVNSKGFQKTNHGRAPIKPAPPAPKKRFSFVADHPFLVFIREDKAGAMAFIGAVFNAAITP